MNRILFSVGALLLLQSFLPVSVYSWPIGPFAQETVSGHITANNGFGWDYNYGIEYKDNKLQIDVQLEFTLTGGVTQAQLNTLKTTWENGIESTWNNNFYILKDDTYKIPIIIDVTYDGPTYNYNVTVRPGPANSNMTTWDTQDTGLVAAHEFGHMLGLFDEYTGGATNPNGELIDKTSIMTDTPNRDATDRLYARHYEGFRSWLAGKDPNETFEVTPVPEPCTLLLVASGSLLAIGRMRRKKFKD